MNFVRNLSKYVRESIAVRARYPGSCSVSHLTKTFPLWERSLNGGSPLSDRRPWITFGAISFLENYLEPGMNAFEWGTGGSTAFFLSKGVNVVSIEHDTSWADMIKDAIKPAFGIAWAFHHLPPEPRDHGRQGDPSNPLDYLSSGKQFQGYAFTSYARAIDQHPEASFDVILVDGRARPSCLHHAIPKVKVGGIIVLDNSDRQHYHASMRELGEHFEICDFPGPSPYVDFFTRTTIWRRKL